MSARAESGGPELLHSVEGDLLGLSDPAVKAVLDGLRVRLPETGVALSPEVLPSWAAKGSSFLWNPAGGLWCWQHLVLLLSDKGEPVCAAAGYFVLPDEYLDAVHRTAYGDSESWLKIACWFLYTVYAQVLKQDYQEITPRTGELSHTFSIDGIPFGMLDISGVPRTGFPLEVLKKALISHHVTLATDVDAAVRESEGFKELLGPFFNGSRIQMVVYG